MKNSTIIILLTGISLVSCVKPDNDKFLNCDQLKKGIIDSNYSILKNEFTKILNDLYPTPDTVDRIGHSSNFDKLLVRLNTCENITSEIRCYACIKTMPPLSEIIVKTDSSGIQIERVIDIVTSDESHLRFAGIHLMF